MANINHILYILATLFSAILAQTESCVSLATSTTCSAFNGSSISTDAYMIGLYPFLRGVSDAASFDRNLTTYVQNGYVQLKYQTLFGCSGISLTNTSNIYARFTTTVICNGVVQNSISRCNLAASNSRPVCVDTCGQYALSEQRILANSALCANPSNYNLTQLRADYTNCGLPETALSSSDCIAGTTNEPTNCGFGYATVGLCQYCSAGGENPSDPCCSRAQASTRCANVVLPSLSMTSAAGFLTATSSMTSATVTPSSGTAVANTLSSNNGRSLSGGAIAGIVVGGVAGLALVILLIILIACCCRRRKKRNESQKAYQSQQQEATARAMVFVPNDSSISSFNGSPSDLDRTPSESEVSSSRPIASKTSIPSASEYRLPPLALMQPSIASEDGRDMPASATRRTKTVSSPKHGSVDGSSTGLFPHTKRSSLASSDYVVLPGGRRARTSVTSDSRPVSSLSTPDDHDKSFSRDKFAAMTGHQSRNQSRNHSRNHSRTNTATALTMPSIESIPTPKDEYEVLPGGRIARKSGRAGFVGGIVSWNALTAQGSGNTAENQKKEPIVTSEAVPVVSEADIATSVVTESNTFSKPGSSADAPEAVPMASPKGPTMPPNSSVKDYYTIAHLKAGDKVRAVWSYAARTRDEFALERGDVLHITSIWGDGWATGQLVKQPDEPSTETEPIADTIVEDSLTPKVAEEDEAKETKETKTTDEVKETRALPLVCVCAFEYWNKVIEAGGKPLASHSFDLI